MKNPLVSILIPVYNREYIVSRAIDSALSQTYKNIEIIICDNASTDGTWSVLQDYSKKDKRVRIFRNESNIGPVQNWKRCLDETRGEYVKFLWSDDKIHPRFIESTIGPMLQNNKIGFAFTDVLIANDNNILCDSVYPIGKTNIYSSSYFILQAFIDQKNMPVSPGCALFRTVDIKKFLVVDIPNKRNLDFSKYGAGNDLLLFLQIAYKYPYFYYLQDRFSVFYASKDSFTINHDLTEYYHLARCYFLRDKIKIHILYLLDQIGNNKLFNYFKEFKKNVHQCKKCIKLLIIRK